MARTAQPKADLYQEVTDTVLAAMESGDSAPWHKSWATMGGLPGNHQTKKKYRGVNVLILMLRQMSQGYKHPLWVTYKQCAALKGQVRKGETGTKIVFWNFFDTTDKKTGKPAKIPYLKSFTVFNVDQCDDLELPEIVPPTPVEIDETAQALCDAWPVKTTHRGSSAFYTPALDEITMPKRDDFDNTSEYYSTLFHEIGHSTGHDSRLKRPGVCDPIKFGSHKYSIEELIAEFIACFLCAATGVDRVATTENSAAYLKHWASKFRADKKLIMQACQAAQKASDAVLIAGGMMEAFKVEETAKAA